MSRIGKKPVPITDGVTVNVARGVITVKGKQGELNQPFDHHAVDIEVADGEVRVTRKNDLKTVRAKHGLYRSLISNMILGCSAGFQRKLEINGVGYSAKAAGKKLTLQIGFCHPVEFEMPDGVKIETPKNTEITITGPDKQAVGQMAANIRRVRPPEPYKGKGIKYHDEVVRRKAGKTVAGK